MLFEKNKIIIFFVLLLSIFTCLCTCNCAYSTVQTKYTIPAPGPSPFGIAWDGTNLWCSDKKTNKFYKINMSGKILSVLDSPAKQPGGLAWDGKMLWNANPRANAIFGINTSGHVVKKFKNPGLFPYSVIWSGKSIASLDRSRGKVYFLDHQGREKSSIDLPFSHPGGIAWDGKFMWIVDGGSGRICLFERGGRLVSSFYPPGRDPIDLTWGKKLLWVIDSVTKKIYGINVEPVYPKPMFIKGRVTYNGKALAGVTITQRGKGKNKTTTDKDGKFSLKAIFRGVYTITPQKKGYRFRPTKSRTTIKRGSSLDNDFSALRKHRKQNVPSFVKQKKNRKKTIADKPTLPDIFGRDIQLKKVVVGQDWQKSKTAEKQPERPYEKTVILDVPKGVVSSFPAPGVMPSGIMWDGKNLWHSDENKKVIYKLDTKGRVLEEIPTNKGTNGLAWDGANIWSSNARTRTLYKTNTKGKKIISFSPPGKFPYGLTWDGESLWHSDVNNRTIYKIDSHGIVKKSFKTPFAHPSGITWDDYHLWVAAPDEQKIYKLTENGKTISSLSSPAVRPEGMAVDGQYLWIVDRLTKNIYKLDTGRYTSYYTVSGTVRTKNRLGVGNVSATLSGKKSAASMSDVYGKFNFSSLETGKYKLTLQKKGYTFLPPRLSIVVKNKDFITEDFTAKKLAKKKPPAKLFKARSNRKTKRETLEGRIVKQKKKRSELEWYFSETPHNAEKKKPSTEKKKKKIVKTKQLNIRDVVYKFRAPGNTPSGIAWDGKNLWHSDDGAIYKLDEHGKVLKKIANTHRGTKGLVWANDKLWTSNVRQRKIYTLDSSTGTVTNSFSPPGSFPFGLAWDGKNIWHSDINTQKIYKLDSDGGIIKSFKVPFTHPSGLAWDKYYLWVAAPEEQKIYKLNEKGDIVSFLPSPALSPKDIALDKQYLWVVDSLTKNIYKLNKTRYTSYYNISGTIATKNMEAVEGVAVKLTGKDGATIITNQYGDFNFKKLESGKYRLTPSKTGYLFLPPRFTVFIKDKGKNGKDFIGRKIKARTVKAKTPDRIFTQKKNSTKKQSLKHAVTPSMTLKRYSPTKFYISGRVAVKGVGLGSVTIVLSDESENKTYSDNSGVFTFGNLHNGEYSLTPYKDGYIFVPPSIDVSIYTAPSKNNNFKAIMVSNNSVDIFKVGLVNPSGIAWDGHDIWLIDRNGKKLYRVSLDGNILQKFNISIDKPLSLAANDDFLWTSSVRKNKLYKLNKKGDVVSVFATPGHFPFGITWGDGALWHTDKNAGTIYKLSGSGKVLSSFKVDMEHPEGLVFRKGAMWVVDAEKHSLVQVDSYGNTLNTIPAPSPSPRDITMINNEIWVIDRTTKKIYKVSLQEEEETYTASGKVTYSEEGVPQVKMTLAGKGESGEVTNQEGYFEFKGLSKGEYTISPVSKVFSFEPEYLNIVISAENLENNTFRAIYTKDKQKQAIRTIGGKISKNEIGLKNINVYISGEESLKSISDADGDFIFRNLRHGTYRVTPKSSVYNFNPTYYNLEVHNTDLGNNYFEAIGKVEHAPSQNLSIAGRVLFKNKALPDTRVKLKGKDMFATHKTDSGGYYTFDKLPIGLYTVTVSKDGFSFAPKKRTKLLSQVSEMDVNFIVTKSPYGSVKEKFVVSGHVSMSAKHADDIEVVLKGEKVKEKRLKINMAGYYSFKDVPKGKYSVYPDNSDFMFFPKSYNVSLFEVDSFGNNFDGMTEEEHEAQLQYKTKQQSARSLAPLQAQPRQENKNLVALFENPTNNEQMAPDSYQGKVFAAPQKLAIPSSYLNPDALPMNIAMDGYYMWVIDSVKKKLYKLDSSRQIHVEVSIPKGTPRSVKIIGDNLYVRDIDGNIIYQMDISSSRDRFNVSGKISYGGVGIANVMVMMTGDESYPCLTDKNGFYQFNGVKKGQYVVRPYKQGVVFTPSAVSITVIKNTDQQNFSKIVYEKGKGYTVSSLRDEIGTGNTDVSITTNESSLTSQYGDVTSLRRSTDKKTSYKIPKPLSDQYKDGRCTSCKKGGKGPTVFPDAPVVINPYTRKPFLIYEIMCFRCHRTLILNHPVGIFPKKVKLPWDAVPIKPGGRDRLTCRGCHDKDKGYYKYMRWEAHNDSDINKICIKCHKDKTIEWAKSHRPIMQQKGVSKGPKNAMPMKVPFKTFRNKMFNQD